MRAPSLAWRLWPQPGRLLRAPPPANLLRLRIVVDTNVVVSALLNPGRQADRVLEAIRSRGDRVLYDLRIEREYREVLARPKFKAIDPERSAELLRRMIAGGEVVTIGEPFSPPMSDPDDRCFVEVALAGKADVLLTGNARDFPTGLGFEVLGPTALMGLLAPGS